jgi:hypothetical protein
MPLYGTLRITQTGKHATHGRHGTCHFVATGPARSCVDDIAAAHHLDKDIHPQCNRRIHCSGGACDRFFRNVIGCYSQEGEISSRHLQRVSHYRLLQRLVDNLLASKLPRSLKELRIFARHYKHTTLSTKTLKFSRQLQLIRFAKRQPRLRYASLSLFGLEWNTYGLVS